MRERRRKILIAWWFAYSITNAAGEPVVGQIVPHFANETTCNRVLQATQTFWGAMLSALPRWGAHFTKCDPDSIDKMPR